MASYSIKDLEKLSGIKAHTIRIWEKRFGLFEPQRTSTNIRTYCDSELKKLLNISLLNKHGFKISKIAQLSQQQLSDKINHLLQNTRNSDSLVENLILGMIDIDEERVDKIISRAIMQFGFLDAVIKVIYPFFERIGIMWQTGIINPAQEHFVTNLIRQKIISAIDNRENNYNSYFKTFIVFLPEGELHEIGILFYTYVIKKFGHKPFYLGQSLPLSDVEEVSKLHPADYILTSIVSSMTDDDIMKYIQILSDKFNDKTILITGALANNINESLPLNIRILSSPVEFIGFIESISDRN